MKTQTSIREKASEVLVKDIIRPISTLVRSDETIDEALSSLQLKEIAHKVIYFYVIDAEGKLEGIVPTRKLLLSARDAKVSTIMDRSIVSLKQHQTLRDAMEVFMQSNLLAIPVVDEENKLLGALDVETCLEESFDVANAHHREDIFQIIGLSLEEEKTASLWRNYRLRMPWLFCNIMGGIFCAIISRMNEAVLGKILLLAMFIPLVLTLSESASMQAMTHSLHFLRATKNKMRLPMKRIKREWFVVGMMALTAGVFVSIVSLFWNEGIGPSIAIGSGIIMSMAISASFGILIPILLHWGKLDPKVASGPVVLTLADVLTTGIYLSLATWMLL